MATRYEDAAAYFLPAHARVLFIAESPPPSVDRYFYFPNVKTRDTLWLELMKALYPYDFGVTRAERTRKPHWLARFADDGYQLIDAVKAPIFGRQNRIRLIEQNSAQLVAEVRSIGPEQILLIKATVFHALIGPLVSAGLRVVNYRPLAFPGSGRQKEFHAELKRFVSMGRLVL